jgi:hypothetical protein
MDVQMTARSAMTPKDAKPAAKRANSSKPKTRRRKPSHDEINQRAYFIYLHEGACDEVANWLRAEHELTTA